MPMQIFLPLDKVRGEENLDATEATFMQAIYTITNKELTFYNAFCSINHINP